MKIEDPEATFESLAKSTIEFEVIDDIAASALLAGAYGGMAMDLSNLEDKLRRTGLMIYTNKTASGTSYRMGEPTQAIINAGVGAVLMNGRADKTIIAAGIKALYGNGVQFAS